MKKHITLIALILIQGVLLTSCFDIYQAITKDSNGNERNIIKVTLNKAILEMGNSMGGGSSTDYDKIFDGSDIDVNSYGQFGAKITKINNESDVGLLVDMSFNYRDPSVINRINQGKVSFIHKYNGKNITIHVDSMGESSEDNQMAAAFLAAGKYRLVISKKCVATVSKVILRSSQGETEYSFLDLVDSYLIEIPIPVLFTSPIDIVIQSA